MFHIYSCSNWFLHHISVLQALVALLEIQGVARGRQDVVSSGTINRRNANLAVIRHTNLRAVPIERICFVAGVLWALPNTLLGLFIGSVGLCFGGRARVRGRAIEFYDGGVKWLIQCLPHGQFTLAFTLGHTILGQTESSLDISRKHETVHVLQYERWGPFFLPAYFLSSVYMLIVGRRFYRDNPFEREAYDVDGSEHDP